MFRTRVDRISDARFERMVLLGIVERADYAADEAAAVEEDMKFLHQHIFWRVDKLTEAKGLPKQGDELLIHFPKEKLYLATH